jgi:formylglycine-generating enzyme required for sulfatase activity
MSSSCAYECRREHIIGRSTRLTLALQVLLVVARMLPLVSFGGDRTIQAAPPATESRADEQLTTKSAEVYSVWPFDAKEAAKRQNDTANSLGVKKGLTLDLGNRVAMKLVLIPAGKHMMGIPKEELLMLPIEEEKSRIPRKLDGSGEGPQHEVTLTRPFYMGIYTVSQAQYQQITGTNPSGFKGATNPVEKIPWADAVDFCQKLSQKTGRTVRLPTEADWEYACRAGTATTFHTGDTINADQANYWAIYTWGNGKKGVYRQKTTPVGTFKPNAWGLYDMHGNVLQWCSDWYGKDYYAKSPAADPPGPETGVRRVMRGGCLGYKPSMCRSAYRENLMPEWRFESLGFRIVVDLE